ncbi:MAG TPA: ThiF family adenylyltransferase [Allosphingosinicella sp.]|nr:ThiF family adenylyltransferase [Allosphingosinicella sp.]
MSWWILQPSRLQAERARIAELQEQVDWLTEVKWRTKSGFRVGLSFSIRHLDKSHALEMDYPDFFPEAPPTVRPVGKKRLSSHQWGDGGELCLEYRPDNWDPAVTGAMMIESAHRLLSGEQPAEGVRARVPSAHNITRAQEARGKTMRFLVSPIARLALELVAEGQAAALTLSEHRYGDNWLIRPVQVGAEAEIIWKEAPYVPHDYTRTGYAVRLSVGTSLPAAPDIEFLRELLTGLGAADALQALQGPSGVEYLLVLSADEPRLLWVFSAGERVSVVPYETISLGADQPRLPQKYDGLTAKSVAIVGCGSVGSKIAASLARAGVGRFVLVDGDFMLPGNVVRHDLDRRAVGMHKADAVAARIRDINAATEVSIRRILLGGQESAESAGSILQAMGQCDLIIDATAEPDVFNLCAAAARRRKKPLLWGVVYAGGIGGLIARVRPDIDPPPHAARRQIAAWGDMQGVAWEGRTTGHYDLERTGLPPLIADDADVSVIAAQLSRMALDTLVRTDSIFPQSAYAIGRAKGWIFSAPFDTHPIAYTPEGSWAVEMDDDVVDRLASVMDELVEEMGLAADEG